MKNIKIYLANLNVEVPVWKLDEEKGQVVIRVSDIPKKKASFAYIDKQMFVRYWYRNGGRNRFVTPHP